MIHTVLRSEVRRAEASEQASEGGASGFLSSKAGRNNVCL